MPLILAVGGGCNTRNLATTYHFTQVECITGGVELDPIWFPEVEAGRESAPRSLSLFNSSFLTTQTGADDFEYEGKESRIRVLGFSATECQEGDPDAFFIQPSLSQGAFPVDLEAGEEMGLRVVFAPTIPGAYDCTFEPDYEILVAPDLSGLSLKSQDDRCTVEVLATGIPAPAAVCALDPPSATVAFGEVEVGSDRWEPLTIRNETPDDIPSNKFLYAFDEGSNDCAVFGFDPPDDASGLIGPAGTASGSKQILTRFAPDEVRPYECVRGLSTLDAPGGEPIPNSCPALVTWRGDGGTGVSPWIDCSAPNFVRDIHSVTGLSTDEVYVAGDGGAILTSTDACQWQSAGTGFSEADLRDLWVSVDGEARAHWAVGNIPPDPGSYQETGVILYSESRDPAAWIQIDEDDLQTFQAVWGSDFDDVYFAGLGVSTDFPNAKRFTGDTQDLAEFTISWSGMGTVTGLGGTAPDDVWAVLHESWNAVYRFRGGDPTQEWQDMTPPYAPISPLNDIWVGAGDGFDVVYAVGDDGAVYRYDRQQEQWLDAESISEELGDLHGVWVSPTGTIFVVGAGPILYQGHVNEPGQWRRQIIPAEAFTPGDVLYDVWGTDDDNVWAVGTNGIILRYMPPAATVGSR